MPHTSEILAALVQLLRLCPETLLGINKLKSLAVFLEFLGERKEFKRVHRPREAVSFMISAISITEHIMLMARVEARSVKEPPLLLEGSVQVHQVLMSRERNRRRRRALHFIPTCLPELYAARRYIAAAGCLIPVQLSLCIWGQAFNQD